MDITKNGNAPQPAMVTTSWVRDEFANGRRRFKLYVMHTPVVQAAALHTQIDASHPRIAGPPTVIGEATIEVPNLEVARMLHAAIGEMLSKQGPEILTVKAAP
ncbi:MAG: hypothetical protein JOZ29_17410 [Deltaproteobacteria bacterium]|nr:hypothetical protein [Deltaproteobacteria bacterium]MBV8454030.1 hypothetical protein [Deltaproteobacteria bacterium]